MKNLFTAFILFGALIMLAACACEAQEDEPFEVYVPEYNGGEPAPGRAPVVITGEFNPITAQEWAFAINAGWNLGNQLDARTGRDESVHYMETAWVGGVAVTPEFIDYVYASGFNGIRIPVTWQKAIDDDFNIRRDWMARVREIVDYAVANDMYIMLNTHHDDEIFRLMDEDMEESRRAVTRIWEQIATEFMYHNERLAFQAFNEPRTRYSPAEWSGGTPEERNNLNELNQLFVDTVRATGGNNAERVLIVPTYAASASATTQGALVVPTDTVADRIIVSLHSYSPWLFTGYTGEGHTASWSNSSASDTGSVMFYINRAYDTFVSQGIPVVFSETGALNRDNLESRVDWTEFYFTQSRSRGIPVFWWDNAQSGVFEMGIGGAGETFGIFDREAIEATGPEIIAAIMRAAEHEMGLFIATPLDDTNVTIVVQPWTGIDTAITAEGSKILTLPGPDVPEFTNFSIALPEVYDTGDGFSYDTAVLTVRNIDNSITDFRIVLEIGYWSDADHHEEILTELSNDELIYGYEEIAVVNEDGSITIYLDLSAVYESFQGRYLDNLRLKMFLESIPYNAEHFDRWGSMEFIDMTLH